MITRIYNDNPNPREVSRVVEVLRNGGIAILPTDTLYAFACALDQKRAAEEIAAIKGFRLKQAKYSLLCADISQASQYTRPLSREVFALVKQSLPGPYTFIMEASGSVPRQLQNAGKTIGLRVPACSALHAIIEELGMPLVATSVRPLGETDDEPENYTDPELIHDRFGNRVAMVVNAGILQGKPSTVIDCTGEEPEVIRE